MFCFFFSLLPKLFKGLVDVLLQNLLHSLDQLHFFLQLLVHRVDDQLQTLSSLPQRQTLFADL